MIPPASKAWTVSRGTTVIIDGVDHWSFNPARRERDFHHSPTTIFWLPFVVVWFRWWEANMREAFTEQWILDNSNRRMRVVIAPMKNCHCIVCREGTPVMMERSARVSNCGSSTEIKSTNRSRGQWTTCWNDPQFIRPSMSCFTQKFKNFLVLRNNRFRCICWPNLNESFSSNIH